ncbi:MAG: hypothetical protein H0T42_32810 [Deltaproteobacteria bacterium]|nr:hypothetical protein [Deltaproteobacteria bacterium]
MLTDAEGLIEVCADELWGGVYCTLPPGHHGSHESAPSHDGGCALTWRADATPVKPAAPSTAHIDAFLKRLSRTSSPSLDCSR